MGGYDISACKVADSDALCRNNIPAWWEDPHWTLTWRHTTLEFLISQVVKRMPRTLLTDRTTKRHEKAVDPKTGSIVGSSRWYLPPSHAVNTDGSPAWPEALVPPVGSEEEVEIRRIADTAIWDPNYESDEMFGPVNKIEDEILAKKPYMRLDFLAVHPKNQGKGVGTALVQSGIRAAEKMGLDIFIRATKAGVGLYKRLGFRVVDELVQDDSMYGGSGEYYVCFMVYEQDWESIDG